MLDVAWPELLVIGAVALVAIGPKDLPKVMRAVGEWTGKARRMTRDIRSAFDQLSYESEIAEKLKNQPQVPSEVVMTELKTPPAPPAPPSSSDMPEPHHDRPAAN
jgi:sec-independent protein translocase protein TatB